MLDAFHGDAKHRADQEEDIFAGTRADKFSGWTKYHLEHPYVDKGFHHGTHAQDVVAGKDWGTAWGAGAKKWAAEHAHEQVQKGAISSEHTTSYEAGHLLGHTVGDKLAGNSSETPLDSKQISDKAAPLYAAAKKAKDKGDLAEHAKLLGTAHGFKQASKEKAGWEKENGVKPHEDTPGGKGVKVVASSALTAIASNAAEEKATPVAHIAPTVTHPDPYIPEPTPAVPLEQHPDYQKGHAEALADATSGGTSQQMSHTDAMELSKGWATSTYPGYSSEYKKGWSAGYLQHAQNTAPKVEPSVAMPAPKPFEPSTKYLPGSPKHATFMGAHDEALKASQDEGLTQTQAEQLQESMEHQAATLHPGVAKAALEGTATGYAHHAHNEAAGYVPEDDNTPEEEKGKVDWEKLKEQHGDDAAGVLYAKDMDQGVISGKSLGLGAGAHKVMSNIKAPGGAVIESQDEEGTTHVNVLPSDKKVVALHDSAYHGPESATAPEPVPIPTKAEDLESMKKVSGPLGSNGGQWYEHSSGAKFFVKPADTYDKVANEVAAGKVYKVAGDQVPETAILHHGNGNVSVVSRHMGDITPFKASTTTQAEARKSFGLDALTSHWDKLGLTGDNAFTDSTGKVVGIDQGGAMAYRAMGGKKDSFAAGQSWVEPATLRSSPQGQKLYGALDSSHDAEIATSLQRAHDLNLDDVAHEWDKAGIAPATFEPWLATLKERQAQIPSLVQKLGGGASAPVAPEETPTPSTSAVHVNPHLKLQMYAPLHYLRGGDVITLQKSKSWNTPTKYAVTSVRDASTDDDKYAYVDVHLAKLDENEQPTGETKVLEHQPAHTVTNKFKYSKETKPPWTGPIQKGNLKIHGPQNLGKVKASVGTKTKVPTMAKNLNKGDVILHEGRPYTVTKYESKLGEAILHLNSHGGEKNIHLGMGGQTKMTKLMPSHPLHSQAAPIPKATTVADLEQGDKFTVGGSGPVFTVSQKGGPGEMVATDETGKAHFDWQPTAHVQKTTATAGIPTVSVSEAMHPTVSATTSAGHTSKPSVLATTSAPADFLSAHQKAQKLTNLGLSEKTPEKAALPEDELKKLDAYQHGFGHAKFLSSDLEPQELPGKAEAALERSQSEVSASGQAAALGLAHGFAEEAQKAPVKPVTSGEAPTDPKSLPVYAKAKEEAAKAVASGKVTSREMYALAGKAKEEGTPEGMARYYAYQEAADQIDVLEGEKPMVDVVGGHADMTAEQVAHMTEGAQPAKGGASHSDLESWAYNQGRAIGIHSANSAVSAGYTAADIEALARKEEELVKTTTGLLQRKHMGIVKGLHRVAQVHHAGNALKPDATYAVQTSASETAPKPDVKYHGPMQSGGMSKYPEVTLKPTPAETKAIKRWTTDYRFATQTPFITAINRIMQGKDPGSGEAGKMAKDFMHMAETKSTPSKQTIYRGTSGGEFSSGQIQSWIDQLVAGETIDFSMPVSSATYSSGVWAGKSFRYVIDPGALTVDIGQFGNHVGEIETVPGGLMEVYKIEGAGAGGTTYIYMRQKAHYVV